MPWQQTEFILKGIYLGLLLFVALRTPTWPELALVGATTLGGLVLCLGVAALRKLREGYRIAGRVPAFILFLILENPGLVYAGIVGGLTAGALTIQREEPASYELLACVLGGAGLGVVFYILRLLKGKERRWANLGLAVVLVGAAIAVFHFHPEFPTREQRQVLGWLLLMGIPLFYLLTFASLVEESEVEIGAICAALAISLWILLQGQSPMSQGLAVILPACLYYAYSTRILPGLRVFKHVLRGISYAGVGQYRWALTSLTRAMQLDPNNRLARQQLWQVYRQMDFNKILDDPDLVSLLNYELCLERVGELLSAPPRPEQAHEAHRLLALVEKQQPAMQPRCDYWEAVAHLHQRDYEQAAAHLRKVLEDGARADENPHLAVIMLPAWTLALTGHPEMIARVGQPLLAEPGRRMQAIAAVERHLATIPDDAGAWDLKRRLLYPELTEAEYNAAAPPPRVARWFDHEFVRQLGLSAIEHPEHWQRGAVYLRLAARGLPQLGAGLFVKIAQAAEKAGDVDAAWLNYRLARDAGHAVGTRNLADEERQRYFAVVKMLADSARDENNLDEAVYNYRLYVESEKAGVETYRQLAALLEKKLDIWGALHATELGLVCNSSDKDLLEKKDRYYNSVFAEELKQRLESVGKWFDATYCINKAAWALDKGGADLEMLDYARHLLDLAQVMQPDSVRLKVMQARERRQRGEIAEAIAILEKICPDRPESFASGEEEEGWLLGCRLLGDLVLHDRPDVAVQCFTHFRKSAKAGADTDYKLGVAYENLGDLPRALKCYQAVVMFENHPLAPEAREAIDRVRRAG